MNMRFVCVLYLNYFLTIARLNNVKITDSCKKTVIIYDNLNEILNKVNFHINRIHN